MSHLVDKSTPPGNSGEMGVNRESGAISRVCGRYSDHDHKIKECIYIKLPCYRYEFRGHKAVVCPYTAHTDAKGRVVTRIENWPGSIKIYQKRDRIQGAQWMNTAASEKVQRWALYLQQFDITVKAIGGVDNNIADWLSLIGPVPDLIADAEIHAISTPVHAMYLLTEEETVRTFAQSPYLPTIDQWIKASKEIPKSDQSYVQRGSDGLWYSIRGRHLYVPKALREPLLYYFHVGKYGGHFGINKTLRRLAKWFYWSKQGADVAEYIAACVPYKRVSPLRKRYLRQILERSELFQLVSLDHIGPREWNGEKVSYLIMIDQFSWYVVAKQVRNVGGSETVRIFSESWIRIFRAPEIVLVDKGPAFKSRTL